jgi:hypothetical protein
MVIHLIYNYHIKLYLWWLKNILSIILSMIIQDMLINVVIILTVINIIKILLNKNKIIINKNTIIRDLMKIIIS